MTDTPQTEPAIKTERDGHVLVVTLNRPDVLNAMTREMQETLERVILDADKDPNVRVLLFTGAGRAFCAGADVSALQAGAEEDVEEQIKRGEPTWTPRQARIYKPSICAVNGVCAGAGLHFVSDCDIVIASEKASFIDSHVNVGQVTALEPLGLMQRMTLTPILRMVILGKAERVTAQQALACQMVSEVLPPEKLMERAMELARLAAGVSPASVQASLKAIYESFDLSFSEAYRRGYEALMRHRDHPDALEGPTAFMEKRDPKWTVL